MQHYNEGIKIVAKVENATRNQATILNAVITIPLFLFPNLHLYYR
jgi:hypothetical protein